MLVNPKLIEKLKRLNREVESLQEFESILNSDQQIELRDKKIKINKIIKEL